jgi:hypothetical protein
MRSFLSLLAAYVAVGGFAVAAVNNMTLQSHSGTQQLVRVCTDDVCRVRLTR